MTLPAYAIRADLLLHPLLDTAAFLQAKTCLGLCCLEAGSGFAWHHVLAKSEKTDF